MRLALALGGLVLIALFLPEAAHPHRAREADIATNLEIPFVANRGQLGSDILYCANSFCGRIALSRDGTLLYDVVGTRDQHEVSGIVLHEVFLDSNQLSVTGETPSRVRVSTFIGNDPSRWQRNLPVFEAIRLHQVWDGIDLTLKARGNSVEKIFRVEPRASVGPISMQLRGAESLAVLESGELEARTTAGNVRFSRPVAYQVADGEMRHVDAAYRVGEDADTYTLEVGAHDPRLALYIDPLISSTYLGGGAAELFLTETDHVDSAIDEHGDIYIAGETNSIHDFPTTPGAYQVSAGGGEGETFVCKMDGALTTLYASTYIGGSAGDFGSALAIDAAGNICIAGSTQSVDFPTTEGAYDRTHNDIEPNMGDAFISILSSDLDELIASTFLGGRQTEAFHHTRLAVDHDGHIFVGGGTLSFDFPVTPGAYITFLPDGGNDLFVSKLSSDLSTLIASSLFGGYGWDQLTDIFIDDMNNVCFCGATGADDFPTTPTAYMKVHQGDIDAFVSVLDNDLDTLVASTYLGWYANETAYALTHDSDGRFYVCGRTASYLFPTTANAYDTTYNGGTFDAFVSVLGQQMQGLIASTFLGGSDWDDAMGIVVDEVEDAVYVTGLTGTDGFPVTPGAFDTTPNGHCDAFISKLDLDLGELLASTLIGGNSYDFGLDIHTTAEGNVLAIGNTSSFSFPTTPGAYDETLNGDYDAYVVLFDPDLSAGITGATPDPVPAGVDQARLLAIRPNPLRSTATIRYRVTESGSVRLGIYDVQGRQVVLLVDGERQAGEHEIEFDARKHDMPLGVYVCRLRTTTSSASWKLVVVD
jgi:hypothetical protein